MGHLLRSTLRIDLVILVDIKYNIGSKFTIFRRCHGKLSSEVLHSTNGHIPRTVIALSDILPLFPNPRLNIDLHLVRVPPRLLDGFRA